MTDQKQNSNFKHIIRVANVDLPGEKKIRFALTKIKGVGMQFADGVCMAAGIKKNTVTGNLSESEIKKLNSIVTKPAEGGIPAWMFNRKRDYETGEDLHIVGGNLHFFQDNDLKRLKKIKTLRGVRHIKGLTVRGQRTRSNFRKNKGKVVGVSKKKVAPAAADKGGAKKEK